MKLPLFGTLLLLACGSGATTSAGPLGETYDLRSDLEPTVASKAPKDADALKREFPVDVHGVAAKIVWRTFEDGPNKYLLSYQWEVATPSAGITLEPLGHMNPINLGSAESVNEAHTVRIRWHDNNSAVSTKFGELSFQIDGAGNGKAN